MQPGTPDAVMAQTGTGTHQEKEQQLQKVGLCIKGL
jgi:hypothetical protein